MPKKPHDFRVGDVVRSKGDKTNIYVVAGTKGWLHKDFTTDSGERDAHISLAKEIGATSLLTRASGYELVRKREDVGAKWWLAFPDGEK